MPPDPEPAPLTQPQTPTLRVAYLALEYLVLFGIGPFAYYADWFRPPLIGLLCAMGAVCGAALLLDRSFDRTQFWNRASVREGIRWVMIRFAVGGSIIAACVALFRPELFFGLLRHNPALWLLIMIGYPVFSVYPQEVIYRAFLFHRYRDLFPKPWMVIAASTAAFGYAHIVFQNPLAVPLTFAGGAIFAWTYRRGRSTLLCSIEHALYGDFIFTIGLGAYFYAGDVS